MSGAKSKCASLATITLKNDNLGLSITSEIREIKRYIYESTRRRHTTGRIYKYFEILQSDGGFFEVVTYFGPRNTFNTKINGQMYENSAVDWSSLLALFNCGNLFEDAKRKDPVSWYNDGQTRDSYTDELIQDGDIFFIVNGDQFYLEPTMELSNLLGQVVKGQIGHNEECIIPANRSFEPIVHIRKYQMIPSYPIVQAPTDRSLNIWPDTLTNVYERSSSQRSSSRRSSSRRSSSRTSSSRRSSSRTSSSQISVPSVVRRTMYDI